MSPPTERPLPSRPLAAGAGAEHRHHALQRGQPISIAAGRLPDSALLPNGHYFVTGTDTGVGKSRISRLLLDTIRGRGEPAVGFKPIAAGGRYIDGTLQSDDAIALRRHSSLRLPHAIHAPYTLRTPVSPDIAAAIEGVVIDPRRIAALHARLSRQAWIISEGLGGWRVPLRPGFALNQLLPLLNCRLVVVVALRVGCINHALLTLESIARSGVELHGWFANRIQPAGEWDEQMVATIERESGLPPLGVIEHEPE